MVCYRFVLGLVLCVLLIALGLFHGCVLLGLNFAVGVCFRLIGGLVVLQLFWIWAVVWVWCF